MHFQVFECKEKNLEQKKPFDFSSSFNVRCGKLWFELFGNIFYNNSVLKQKKWKCISSLQKCHDPIRPFNYCKDVNALLTAFKDDFRNSLFIDVCTILQPAFKCIETTSNFKAAIKKSPFDGC